jgi:hypothetical protein
MTTQLSASRSSNLRGLVSHGLQAAPLRGPSLTERPTHTKHAAGSGMPNWSICTRYALVDATERRKTRSPVCLPNQSAAAGWCA